MKDLVDPNAQEYYSHGHSSHRSYRRPRRVREERDLMVENLGGYKMKVPPFHGKNDLLAEHLDPLTGDVKNGHHTIRDASKFCDSEFDPIFRERVEGV